MDLFTIRKLDAWDVMFKNKLEILYFFSFVWKNINWPLLNFQKVVQPADMLSSYSMFSLTTQNKALYLLWVLWTSSSLISLYLHCVLY